MTGSYMLCNLISPCTHEAEINEHISFPVAVTLMDSSWLDLSKTVESHNEFYLKVQLDFFVRHKTNNILAPKIQL